VKSCAAHRPQRDVRRLFATRLILMEAERTRAATQEKSLFLLLLFSSLFRYHTYTYVRRLLSAPLQFRSPSPRRLSEGAQTAGAFSGADMNNGAAASLSLEGATSTIRTDCSQIARPGGESPLLLSPDPFKVPSDSAPSDDLRFFIFHNRLAL